MTIQNEFIDIVFEFAKMAGREDGILSVILFGSVARGEADKRSDLDMLVVFDTDKKDLEGLKERGDISQLSLDLGKKFEKNIQIVFSNKNFDGLDRQFVETIFREGVILFGENPQVDIKKLKLEPFSLFHYSLKELGSPEKMKVKRIFYGHETRKNYKGKIYKSGVKGLLDELGGKRTGIASFLVPSKKSQDVATVLRRLGVKFEKTDVWISQI